ncbi:hypothetical protein D3C76_1204680 [compost metagenome]
MVVNAFFLAQALQQGQVGFLVLNAKRPQGIVPVCQVQAIAVYRQAMLLQQLAQDHGHAEALENPPRSVSIQCLKGRHQHQFIAYPATPSMFAAGAMQHAMNALALPKVEQRRLLQQPFKVEGRCQADHFDIESIGLIEGLAPTELHHLQTQVIVEECQGEGTFLVVLH